MVNTTASLQAPTPGSSLNPSESLGTGFALLIAAQFASALADNALLIVTMALLHAGGYPAWWAPMLKFAFTLAYVVLAPFVGPLADAMPKARLMAWMNLVKILGALGLIAGLHPLAAFAVVGLGAAAYAPAKYGLITEIVSAKSLVRANAWLEVSVVCAALLGAAIGGFLVSPMWHGLTANWPQQLGWAPPTIDAIGALSLLDSALGMSLLTLLGVYGIAAALNFGIPDSGAKYPTSHLRIGALVKEFVQANRLLWRDRDGALSLTVTTIFWGVGATLQFAVLQWATQVLRLPLDQASYLQAAVAAGVIAGAAAAGRWVPLSQAKYMLVAGVGMGLLMTALSFVDNLGLALPLLVAVGAVGGLLVVPLNALLQHRGCTLLSAGRSVAVQGFNENASVLTMLAAYAGMVALELPMTTLMCGFGLSIAVAMVALMWREARRSHL